MSHRATAGGGVRGQEWEHAREECRRLHPGYDFTLWTDQSARDLVAEHYPDYLDMCRCPRLPSSFPCPPLCAHSAAVT